MSDDYKRGYSKGYAAGSRGTWPDYRPIKPPDEIVGALVEAVQKFRDAVDGQLAMLDPDDEWQTTLGEPMDAVTESLGRIGEWVRNGG